jgi:holo-[acyl-carrier protein] synthase
MITGIGVDIIEVDRIKTLAEKNPRFLQRVFTSKEIEYCEGKKNKYLHFSARFAVKEAFFKALGRKIKWTHVWTTNLPSGKPLLGLTAEENFPFDKSHVSLSHLTHYAMAIVILEKIS